MQVGLQKQPWDPGAVDLNEPEGLDANLPDFETWFFTGSEKRCPTTELLWRGHSARGKI